VSEPTTSRERLAAALEATLKADVPYDPAMKSWLVDADDLARLVAAADEALFGPEPPGPDTWVGPLLTTDELNRRRKQLADGMILQPAAGFLGHIDCQSATIRNLNDINADLHRRLAEALVELDRLRGALELRKALHADG
jgi:hypothetical protein